MGVLKSEQKMFVFLILSVLLINTKCPKFTLGLLIMSLIFFFLLLLSLYSVEDISRGL